MAYRCRCCGRRQEREDEEGWLLGLEKLHEDDGGLGPFGLQKTFVFLDGWDASRARERDAVHFCSAECKEEYLSMWCGELSMIA